MAFLSLAFSIASFAAVGWLLYAGHWRLLVAGLALIIGGRIALGLLLAAQVVFMVPMHYLLERGHKTTAGLLAVLAQAYSHALLMGWCLGVYLLFLNIGPVESEPWPAVATVLWSIGVALAPWEFMAQADARAGSGDAAGIVVAFGTIAYALHALAHLWLHWEPPALLALFGTVMTVSILVQMVVTVIPGIAAIPASRPARSRSVSRASEPPWQ